MEFLSYESVARALLTVVTAGYGVGLIVADVNNTHVTNPLWTPHARFHCVWQIASYSGFALIALALIWLPGPLPTERLYLASGFAIAVIGGFLIAYATMAKYGGANHDINGHLPKPVAVFGRVIRLDANTTVFSVLSALLIAAIFAISKS